jgi:nitrous oxidase accessory protein NosD
MTGRALPTRSVFGRTAPSLLAVATAALLAAAAPAPALAEAGDRSPRSRQAARSALAPGPEARTTYRVPLAGAPAGTSAAATGDGFLVVQAVRAAEGDALVALRIGPDENQGSRTVLAHLRERGLLSAPALASSADGVGLAWCEGEGDGAADVWFGRLDDAQRLAPVRLTVSGLARHPRVVAAPEGGWIVAWEEPTAASAALRLVWLTADGEPVAPASLVATGLIPGTSSLAAGTAGPVASWRSGDAEGMDTVVARIAAPASAPEVLGRRAAPGRWGGLLGSRWIVDLAPGTDGADRMLRLGASDGAAELAATALPGHGTVLGWSLAPASDPVWLGWLERSDEGTSLHAGHLAAGPRFAAAVRARPLAGGGAGDVAAAAGSHGRLLAWAEPDADGGAALHLNVWNAPPADDALGLAGSEAGGDETTPEPDSPATDGGILLDCGGDRYVDPTGDDSGNDCRDELAPCATIGHALAESCDGETVFVAEGTYPEDLVIDHPVIVESSGAASSTTVSGTGTNSGAVVTILANDVDWDGLEISGHAGHPCVRVGDATHTDLRGVQVKNSALFGCSVGIVMESTGSPVATGAWNRILSIDARDTVTDGSPDTGAGILLLGGNGKLEIKASFLRNNPGVGLRVGPPTDGRTNERVVIVGNRIYDNGLDTAADSTAGVEIFDVADLRFEGNHVYGHTGTAAGDDGRGVLMDAVSSGNVFCNRIRTNDTGIELTNGTGGLEILHNRFADQAHTALLVGADSGASTRVNEDLFAGNALAIDYQADGTLDATHSWWGDPTGPGGDPGGAGDPVSGNVDVGGFIDRSMEPLLVKRPVDFGWSPSVASCYDRLQPGLDAAAEGQLVLIGAGTHREHVTLAKRVDIEGIDGGDACSPSEIDGTQSGGSHLPALQITGVDGMTVRNLTVRSAGEGTVCGENTGDEVGIDLVDVTGSSFSDLCLQENGVTELRVRGASSGLLLEDIEIDGMLRAGDGSDECGHRSREGVLIDGGPACEGGDGSIVTNVDVVGLQIDNVARGVRLRLADATDVTACSIHPSPAPAWDNGELAVGVLVEMASQSTITGNDLGFFDQTEGIRVQGREEGSCVTERTDATDTFIADNVIADALGAGVRLYRGSADPGAPLRTEIRCNDITRNDTGILVDSAGSGADANWAEFNDIRQNVVGLRNTGIQSFDATDNWWGSASGPGGSGSGSGDPVYGSVVFSPWLDSRASVDNDGDGVTECGGDCDDSLDSVYPDAPEQCDGFDNDCDGSIDEDLPEQTWYRDADGDGFGDAGNPLIVCDTTPPDGYTGDDTDCDDSDPDTYPGAPEVLCDGVDQGCDGPANETTDDDVDGYDVCDATAPGDSDGLAADCDDGDPLVNPGRPELSCDGIDNDCDGTVDQPGVTCSELEAQDLVFAAGSTTTMTWSAAAGADAYALYRGSIPAGGFARFDHGCAGSELSTPEAQDPNVPPGGEAFYYLATGLQVDAVTGDIAAGPLGNDSGGSVRPESGTVTCGPRIYVDPDAVGAGDGLSWADAYTTVRGALDHGRARERGLEVWMTGTTSESDIVLTPDKRHGVRLLGGFAGTEAQNWERDPALHATTWRGSAGQRLLGVDDASVVLDGLTLETGTVAVEATVDNQLVRLSDVTARSLTGRVVGVTVDGPHGARLEIEGLDADAAGEQAVLAVAEQGRLSGYVRTSVLAGGSDAAVRVESRGALGAAETALAIERNRIEGGARGIVLLAQGDDAGFDAAERSVVASNLVHSTTAEGVRVEAAGSFATFAGPLSVTATPTLTGNTISDAGAAGILVSASRTDTTADPALHECRAEPALWDNLVTFHAGAGVEETADDPANGLVADPLLVGNGLFGSSPQYLDEGTDGLGTAGEIDALGDNRDTFVADPLYIDRPGGDYRLGSGSPAIDRGHPEAPGLTTRDVDGAPRVQQGAPDVGAHESGG